MMNQAKLWKVCRDPKTRRHYYYNTRTKKTQWKRPPELGPATRGSAPAKAKGGGWDHSEFIAKKDGKGRTYYINVRTKKSRWKVPEGAKVLTMAEYKRRRAEMRRQATGHAGKASFDSLTRAANDGARHGHNLLEAEKHRHHQRLNEVMTLLNSVNQGDEKSGWADDERGGIIIGSDDDEYVADDGMTRAKELLDPNSSEPHEFTQLNKFGMKQQRKIVFREDPEKKEEPTFAVVDPSSGKTKKTFVTAEVQDVERSQTYDTSCVVHFGPPEHLPLYEQLKFHEQPPYELSFRDRRGRERFIEAMSYARRAARLFWVDQASAKKEGKLAQANVAHWQIALVLGHHTLPLTLFWQSAHDGKPGVVVLKDAKHKTRLSLHDDHIRGLQYTTLNHKHKGAIPKELAGVAPILLKVDSKSIKSGEVLLLFEDESYRTDFSGHAQHLLGDAILVHDEKGHKKNHKIHGKLSKAAVLRG
jgi:hypothetical protein